MQAQRKCAAFALAKDKTPNGIIIKNMEQKKNTSYQTEKIVKPAPLWKPTGCDRYDFITSMQYHAPFIYTSGLGQTDLEHCIICTFPPHLVFAVRSFKTVPVISSGNDNELQRCIEREQQRLEYLHQRYQAIKNGQEAAHKKKAIKKIIREDRGGKYDQELDEPRVVGKVPGLNVYLELIGCLDKIPVEQLDWAGEKGVYWTMDYALSYAMNFFKHSVRRRMASKKTDPQPIKEWMEDWDEEARPYHQPRNGLGYTNIDPSRRFADDAER